MKKSLSDMTLEELWQLFPIVLTANNPCWDTWYQEEEGQLHQLLPMAEIVRISHIGSTAIKTIYAKPIIDILVETASDSNWNRIRESLLQKGYLCMSESKNRLSFNKGYTEEGFADKVYHLHLRYAGDHDELYFRDYLIEFPRIANEYEKLKLNLWKLYEHNRNAYTDSKTAFISQYTQEAKQYYGKRY